MEIREERAASGILVIAPVGRIDSNTSGELEEKLFAHLAAGETRLVIDMQQVEYISSAGLRVLLRLAQKLRERGRLVLCSLAHSVRQVFELAGFLVLFAIEPSRELAVARMASGG